MEQRIVLETLSAEDWHRILLRFSDARIEQTHTYAEVRAAQAHKRHLIIYERDAPVAAAQVVERQVPFIGKRVAFVKYGPVWRQQKSEPQPIRLETALSALHTRLVQNEGVMLRVMPAADPLEPNLPGDSLAALGFTRKPIDFPERYLVDLELSEDDLRASLKSKWRYNLKRAHRHGMTVRRFDDEAAIEQFMQLHRRMLQRKTFAEPFDIDALRQLTQLPNAFRPQVLLCEFDGRPVAGAVITITGDTAVYLLGAMNRQGADLDAGYVLHWHALEWLKTQPCRWYDLGGDCGDAGLRQFKSGLVGKRGRLPPLPGNFDAASTKGAAWLGRLAFGLRDLRGSIDARLHR